MTKIEGSTYFSDLRKLLYDAIEHRKMELHFVNAEEAYRFRQRLYRQRSRELSKAEEKDPVFAEIHPFRGLYMPLDGTKLTLINTATEETPLRYVVTFDEDEDDEGTT